MATFDDIKKANETIATMDIKGKEYALLNQRIKAFRMVYPEGSIITEIISLENGICTIKATAKSGDNILGTGYAQEKEGSTYINATSYIENCETSAVGRALGMCGFGIDTSVCSAEELQNAINNQDSGRVEKAAETPKESYPVAEKENKKEYATEEQCAEIRGFYRGKYDLLEKVLKKHGVTSVVQLNRMQAQSLIDRINVAKAKAGIEG